MSCKVRKSDSTRQLMKPSWRTKMSLRIALSYTYVRTYQPYSQWIWWGSCSHEYVLTTPNLLQQLCTPKRDPPHITQLHLRLILIDIFLLYLFVVQSTKYPPLTQELANFMSFYRFIHYLRNINIDTLLEQGSQDSSRYSFKYIPISLQHLLLSSQIHLPRLAHHHLTEPRLIFSSL